MFHIFNIATTFCLWTITAIESVFLASPWVKGLSHAFDIASTWWWWCGRRLLRGGGMCLAVVPNGLSGAEPRALYWSLDFHLRQRKKRQKVHLPLVFQAGNFATETMQEAYGQKTSWATKTTSPAEISIALRNYVELHLMKQTFTRND